MHTPPNIRTSILAPPSLMRAGPPLTSSRYVGNLPLHQALAEMSGILLGSDESRGTRGGRLNSQGENQ
jgi:hypothetical protein